MMMTKKTAKEWFDALFRGDFDGALALVDQGEEWHNISPVPGVTDCAPWLDRFRGLPAVEDSFNVWAGKSEMIGFELLELTVENDRAIRIVHEHARCIATGVD